MGRKRKAEPVVYVGSPTLKPNGARETKVHVLRPGVVDDGVHTARRYICTCTFATEHMEIRRAFESRTGKLMLLFVKRRTASHPRFEGPVIEVIN